MEISSLSGASLFNKYMSTQNQTSSIQEDDSSDNFEVQKTSGGMPPMSSSNKTEETEEYDPLDTNKDGIVDASEEAAGDNQKFGIFQSTEDFLSLISMGA